MNSFIIKHNFFCQSFLHIRKQEEVRQSEIPRVSGNSNKFEPLTTTAEEWADAVKGNDFFGRALTFFL